MDHSIGISQIEKHKNNNLQTIFDISQDAKQNVKHKNNILRTIFIGMSQKAKHKKDNLRTIPLVYHKT